MSDELRIKEALVIRPGDNVLVTITGDFDVTTAKDMQDSLVEQYPQVSFTFIHGATVTKIERESGEQQ